jgi:hypothetical protein
MGGKKKQQQQQQATRQQRENVNRNIYVITCFFSSLASCVGCTWSRGGIRTQVVNATSSLSGMFNRAIIGGGTVSDAFGVTTFETGCGGFLAAAAEAEEEMSEGAGVEATALEKNE